MKASKWVKSIKGPAGRAVWMFWLLFCAFSLSLQTVCYYWILFPSPAARPPMVVKASYFIYITWTFFAIIYCIKRLLTQKKKNFQLGSGTENVSSAAENDSLRPVNARGALPPATSDTALHQNQDKAQAAEFLQRLVELFESGKKGQALIQKVSYTGAFVGAHPFLKLHLLIKQKEKPPLKLVACTVVNKHFIPRIGDHYLVKYLSGENPIAVILDFL